MSSNLNRTLQFRKSAASGKRGVVSAQNQKAADVGAEVLRQGGNAIDAAVATSFALGVLEPWMSGVGGIGYMQIWDAKKKQGHVIDFSAISASKLDPSDYPLVGGQDDSMFGWPSVVEDRNIYGYSSMALPGVVDGMRLAHATFGTRNWAELLAPAIELARRGMEIDWFLVLQVTNAARALIKSPAAKAVFLADGLPPAVEAGGYLKNDALLATLQRLAKAGGRDYYEGELAKSIASDLAKGGSKISADDLRSYKARLVEPLRYSYGGKTLHLPPNLTAGPSLRDALEIAGPKLDRKGLSAQSFVAYIEGLTAAYEKRLAGMGDSDNGKSCTSNFCVVDSDGNMVAVTQTLLAAFGSCTMLPGSGITMNNGIMWFDPTPGKPNSIGAGKRPLSNMLPTVVLDGDTSLFAVGASGGRRIMPAVMQIISFLVDYGMPLEAAFHQPRIDASIMGQPWYDPQHDLAVQDAVKAKFPGAVPKRRDPLPLNYACPAVAMLNADGSCSGMTEIAQPWASSSAA
ncbi:gamma-glutamyltransferase [Ferrovibrio terrae]|uniref:gamma-glutamyltransferase family protein n=1 Tax=Ferrovibrio terrae TaxID=2594003 RepID=UPI003137CE9B